MQNVTSTKLSVNCDLKIETRSDNLVIISTGNAKFKFDSVILAILGQFSKPRSISDAIKNLKSQIISIQRWIELNDTILGLCKNNILVEADLKRQVLNTKPGGYNSASFHIALLNDSIRTNNFIEAIRKTVKKTDVVLDIGTGTGVLAIAAAKCGAKHVYAIEASEIAELAKENIARNDLSGKITLIKGYSSQVELPQKADVLVSEVIGNDPLEENILEIYSDAFKRHLKKNARCIPEVLKIYGIPLTIPVSMLTKHYFGKGQISSWQGIYGIDFSALNDAKRPDNYSFYVHPAKAVKWNILSPPVLLANLKLDEISNISIKNKCSIKTTVSGRLNGILIYFQAALAGNIKLSTNPVTSVKGTSWTCRVWVIPETIVVKKGQKLDIEYNYRAGSSGNSIRLNVM